MLARESAQPLYAQIQQWLLKRIEREYQPGDLLPTQHEISAETGASLITVKRALTELSRRGIIESIRGRGTVVRPLTVSDNHANISSWTDSITGLGSEPQTAWTKIDVRVPPVPIRRLLRLKSRERTVRLRRLRLVDGLPMCLMTNELPLAMVPDLAERGLDRESFYACLQERYGLTPAWAEESVRARPSTSYEKRVLSDHPKVVIVIRRNAMLADGRPLEFGKIVASASRYTYRVRLMAERR